MTEPTPQPHAPARLLGYGAVLKLFSFVNYSIVALLVTVFPVYFDIRGLSDVQIGLIFAIGPTVGIVANLLWGIASDRYQTTKKIIVILLAGELACLFLMFASKGFAPAFLAMGLFYFFQAPVNPLNDSQILLSARQSGKSYASFRVYGSFGFACASVLFGFLLLDSGIARVALLSLGTVIAALTVALLMKDTRAGMNKMDFSGVANVFFSGRLLLFLFLALLLGTANQMNNSFLTLHLRHLGASQTVIGFSWMASSLSEIPMFFLLSRFGHRFRELPLLAFAAGAYTLRFLLLSFPVGIPTIIATQAMHSVTFGIFLVTALRYLQELVPDQFRSTGQALYNITWTGFSSLIGGLVGGLIFQSWGGQALYSTAAVIAALACFGFFAAGVRDARLR